MNKFFIVMLIPLSYLVLAIISCKNKTNDGKLTENTIASASSSYDTVKYNKQVLLDTTGCSWIFEGREILDTLVYEQAFVRAYEDTFLATKKFKRLVICNLPVKLLQPNDTVLLSGLVYKMYSSEQFLGFPAAIKEILLRR